MRNRTCQIMPECPSIGSLEKPYDYFGDSTRIGYDADNSSEGSQVSVAGEDETTRIEISLGKDVGDYSVHVEQRSGVESVLSLPQKTTPSRRVPRRFRSIVEQKEPEMRLTSRVSLRSSRRRRSMDRPRLVQRVWKNPSEETNSSLSIDA